MRLRTLAFFCLPLAFAASAHATEVIGNINVDTHWTLAGSPYVLTGDVTVAPQATLSIDSGVVVQAAANDGLGSGTQASKVELIIKGALIANGKSGSPIVFQGASAGRDAWYGISFEPGARASSLTYVQISDATYGIWSRTTSSLVLSDLSISNSTTGIFWQAAPGPTITRASLSGFASYGIDLAGDGSTPIAAVLVDSLVRGAGTVGVQLRNHVSAVVRRNQLVQNGIGLAAEAGSSLTFVNNVVAGNFQKGVELNQSGSNAFTIFNNTVDHNVVDSTTATLAGIGIHALAVSQASSFVVRNNIVTNHGTAGLKVDGAAPSLDHNNVWGNTANYVGASAGVGSISANPLYVRPIGASGDWLFVSSPLSVRSPGSGYNHSWTFDVVGAAQVRLRITTLSTESCCDRLVLTDRTGAQVGSYSGSFSGTTAAANGTRLVATFTTDGSVDSFGFDAAGYEYKAIGYNYRLQASSPAIDVGNDLDAPSDDADGTARPYDGDVNGTSTTDMGAYEWHENISPLAVAGPDQTVLPNTQVSFDATGSRDPDGAIVGWDWDFGDGSAHATTRAATHTYAVLGTYTVTLTVTDDQGAIGQDTMTVVVASNLPPRAEPGNDQFVDVGATVSFDGGASFDPDGTIVGYAWNFGDGAPQGSGRTVTHAYAHAGVYTVTLTVTDDRGATGTKTTAVVVGSGSDNAPPHADAGGPYAATLGHSVSLDGSRSTDSDGALVSYGWSFGDGQNGTGAQVSHTYAAAGNYLVTLTVTDNGGATGQASALVTISAPGNQPPVANAGGNRTAGTGETVHLDGSGSRDADGSIVSYAWEFGDGQSGTGATPTHSYAAAGAYLVRLTVTDNGGAIGQDQAIVTVSAPTNQAPVASAGGNRAASLGDAVHFDGSGSHDADGSIVSYAWDFGDGQTGSGVAPAHVYASAGNYLVRLTVTDDLGATGTDVALATVSAPGNQPPVANAGGDRSVGIGESVHFDGRASSDADGSVVSYAWSFGDGQTGSDAQPTHSYTAAGTYLVRLTVTDDDGAIGQDIALITVGGESNQPPVASAGGNRTAAVAEAVSFDGSASRDPDGSIASYAWDFGDGASGTGARPSHSYAGAGSYLVRLVVTDNRGATAQDVALVTVTGAANQPPVANAGGNRSASPGESLQLDGSRSRDPDGSIATYVWDFGDGSTGVGMRPAHSWAAAGTYLVRLTVTDNADATATDFAAVTVGNGGGSASGGCSAAPGQDGAAMAVLLLVGALAFASRRRLGAARRRS